MNKPACTYSKIESERFGKKIHRGSFGELNIHAVKQYLDNNDLDILIFRIPVQEQQKLHELNCLGHDFIVADTLVYYKRELQEKIKQTERDKELTYVAATTREKNLVENLMSTIFKNYINHYSSNPLLDSRKISEGYTEWALSHIDNPGKIFFIFYKDAVPVGIAACTFDGTESDGVLFGVHPDHTGKGYFRIMLRSCLDYFAASGHKRMLYSTQVQNIIAQQGITKEGFIIEKAYLTIHVNKVIANRK